MSLSKKSLKRRNYTSKLPHLTMLAAARRMNAAAEAYNATAQQGLSSKHHPEQAVRDAVRLYRNDLYAKYRKARTKFFALRRKYGAAFTSRVLRNMDTKPARRLLLEELLGPKPGWVRKKIVGTSNPYAPRPALLSEWTDSEKVCEMGFEQATILFKRQIAEELVKHHNIVPGVAVSMVEDYGNNKDLLLKVLNELIEKEELKVYFARHKILPSDTPFNITKITDI